LAAQSLRYEAAELEAIRKHRLHPGGEPNPVISVAFGSRHAGRQTNRHWR
jgi:hypothetical protein